MALANNKFQSLLNIEALGFEDKCVVKLLTIYDINSYLIRDKGEILNKVQYGFFPSRDNYCVINSITFSLVSKEVNAILDTISSRPQLSQIPKYKIVLAPEPPN